MIIAGLYLFVYPRQGCKAGVGGAPAGKFFCHTNCAAQRQCGYSIIGHLDRMSAKLATTQSGS